jgi:uncharacterized protein YndB with AHSA1/START domain
MLIALVVIATIILVVMVVAATKPSTFRIERSAVISKRPEEIVRMVQNFHEWSRWSPWEKLDPAMKRSHSGSSDGEGAIYEWEGNGRAGAGRMEITQVVWPEKVIIRLDFFKPFKASNTAEFVFTPRGDGTNVNWAMYGPSSFMSKVMSVFMNMDKMIGKDFEAGLQNLKSVCEGQVSK